MFYHQNRKQRKNLYLTIGDTETGTRGASWLDKAELAGSGFSLRPYLNKWTGEWQRKTPNIIFRPPPHLHTHVPHKYEHMYVHAGTLHTQAKENSKHKIQALNFILSLNCRDMQYRICSNPMQFQKAYPQCLHSDHCAQVIKTLLGAENVARW